MEWLRNVWGNIDQFGRHVYDVMQRAQHVYPYDRLSKTTQGDLAESGKETGGSLYGTFERPATAFPFKCESPSAMESE